MIALALLALLTPLVAATLGVLLAALVLAARLSVLIARRERGLGEDDLAEAARITGDPRGAPPVVQAALTLSERLTALSGGLDLSDIPSLKASAVSPSRAATDSVARTSLDQRGAHTGAPDAPSRSAAPAPQADAPVAGAPPRQHAADPGKPGLGQARGQAGRASCREDTTVRAEVPAAGVVGPVVHVDDATRLFGRDDATRFFGPEDHTGPDDESEGDHTRFLSPPPSSAGLDDADGERDACDAGAPGHPAAILPHPIQRGPTPQAAPGPAGDDPYAGSGTHMLRALPPARTVPPLTPLAPLHAHLRSIALPSVLALAVLDGAGRVLAGNADADLTGELRSLMAESGLGNTADLEQPVRFADEAPGLLVLVPTGANALLGALVHDGEELPTIRVSLRALAQEIGTLIAQAA